MAPPDEHFRCVGSDRERLWEGRLAHTPDPTREDVVKICAVATLSTSGPLPLSAWAGMEGGLSGLILISGVEGPVFQALNP